MTLLGIATIAVIGLVGRRLAGPVVGLVAAGIAAVYPNLWINDSLVMSESLAVPARRRWRCSSRSTLDDDPAPGAPRVLGVLVGLACLTRSELGLLAVGFAGLAWWRVRPGDGGAGGCSRPAPRCSPRPRADGRAVGRLQPDPVRPPGAAVDERRHDAARRQLRPDVLRRPRRLGHPLPRPGAERRHGRRVRALGAAARPRGRLRRGTTSPGCPSSSMARVGRSLDVYGLSSLVALDRGEEKAAWAVWAGIVVLVGRWPIAAIVGWRVLGRDDAARRGRAGGSPSPLLTVLVTTILFYGAHRIRAPAEPAVVVLAAVGLVAGGLGSVGAPATRPTAWRADCVAPPVVTHAVTVLDAQARRAARRAARRSAASSWRSAAAPTRRSSPPSPTRRSGRLPSHAVTAVSPSLAGAEREDCRALAARVGAALDAGRHGRDGARRVPPQRHRPLLPLQGRADGRRRADRRTPSRRRSCSASTSTTSATTAPASGRPREAGAAFPLVAAGFTKADVRAASRRLGLRTWDKPAAACLASRVPYGTEVTVTVLSRGRAGRGRAARPRLRPGPRPPLRRHGADRGRAGRARSRRRRTRGRRRRRAGRRLPLRDARPGGLPLRQPQRLTVRRGPMRPIEDGTGSRVGAMKLAM